MTSGRGSGSYVIKKPDSDVLRFYPLSSITDIQRCFEFRADLEAEAAGLAASRRANTQLEIIQNAYERIDIANASSKLAIDEDFSFHYTMIDTANNYFYNTILKSLEKLPNKGLISPETYRYPIPLLD